MTRSKLIRKIYAQFPEGKYKVLTLSYDDGKVPDKRLVSIINEYGLKCTFNINSGMENNSYKNAYDERIPLSEVKELYKGHEIACHTVNHPTIGRCPKELMIQELLEDRRNLEELLGETVRGLAYPNGSFNDDVVDALKACGFAYGRTVNSTNSFDLPSDPFRWNPTCHHESSSFENLYNDFLMTNKSQYMYCMYVWGHSYEFEKDDNWSIIEKFSKKIGNKSDIWYATNIEIIDYLDAVKRLQVSVNGDFAYNPSAKSVWIEVENKTVELKGGATTEL